MVAVADENCSSDPAPNPTSLGSHTKPYRLTFPDRCVSSGRFASAGALCVRMGNQLTRDYDVDKAPAATGGPGGLWRVHDAVKKGTGRAVSVWVRRLSEHERDRDRERAWA
jgi:hypothetical protein